ncbi:MAG: iron ABC transporter substrate-binding protein [Deltaproteobacteria bacterium]|nr:iron ABC transporter substrate-binding protein [Deltaproteobacteria bacterium]
MKKVILAVVISIFFYSNAVAENISITDMAGRQVSVPNNPAKIICIGPGTLRLVSYLNVQHRAVGIEEMEKIRPEGRPYRLANPNFVKLPTIGPGGPAAINKKPNMEAVLKAAPDIIFASYLAPFKADEIEKSLNIPVVIISYGMFATFDETVYKSIALIGKILNVRLRASQVINYIESARKDLQKRTLNITDDKKPYVYPCGIGYRGTKGIESSDKNYIPLKWINAKNIAEKIPNVKGSHIFINKEKLLLLNPDIIFIDGGGKALIEQDIIKKPDYYKGLKAFANKKVYILFPFNFYVTNIGTAIANAYTIGKILYSKKFYDINPEKKADEIYTFLTGSPVYKDMKKKYGKIGEAYKIPKEK